MADNTHRPYRGPAHGDQHSSSGGDPLSELARLIGGQNDPFASPARAGRQDAANWHPDPYGHPDPRVAAAQSDYPEPFPSSAKSTGHAGYDASYGGRRETTPAQYGAPPQYGAAAQYGAPPPYQGQDYSDPFYRDGDGHDDYDDHAPARRRGGMLTVMAVIALALIGTAAAFGYRAIFGGSGSSTPPVIKADTTPAKIVPAATSNDQSKQIYDRVGDRPSAERVVSREEKPVDINDSLKNPRIVGGAPAAMANSAGSSASAGLPANASALQAPGAASANTPKRVRTVTIKPDGSDGKSPVATAARTTSGQQMASQPVVSRVASATPQDRDPAPVPVRTVSTRAPVQQATPPSNPNAPLSLAPPPAGGAARAPAARTATVASAPSVATASAGGGGYAVQVSSQRSEAEAQAAFRALQSKYPDQLGGQQPVIRRADLGDKGVFYRVQVGPFGSSDQASELCSSLKNAGGSCVVQRN